MITQTKVLGLSQGPRRYGSRTVSSGSGCHQLLARFSASSHSDSFGIRPDHLGLVKLQLREIILMDLIIRRFDVKVIKGNRPNFATGVDLPHLDLWKLKLLAKTRSHTQRAYQPGCDSFADFFTLWRLIFNITATKPKRFLCKYHPASVFMSWFPDSFFAFFPKVPFQEKSIPRFPECRVCVAARRLVSNVRIAWKLLQLLLDSSE